MKRIGCPERKGCVVDEKIIGGEGVLHTRRSIRPSSGASVIAFKRKSLRSSQSTHDDET
jgi:hypothetical protein